MTNPERLWAYVYNWSKPPFAHVGTRACLSKDEVSKALAVTRCDSACTPSEPAEYVRADVAAAKEEAARAQSKEGWKSFGEAMALVQAEADEKHALRAEVEALRTLAKRAADLLRPSFRLTVDGRDTPPNALVADIDAALAKGVG